MDEGMYYLWLQNRLGPGSRAAVRLVRAAGSAEAVWNDPSDDLGRAARVKPAVMDKLRLGRDLSDCSDIISWCADKNVTLLTPDMPNYPKSLLCLMDYPMALYCAGRLPNFNSRFCCAVVGTRKMTEYGKRTAYDIGWGLGDGGAVLVSGLALGIDGMAMAGAQSAGGVTVGVLGCGIDITYPAEHREMFARTAERGAVITEYPPGSPPAGEHFPVRNRIISGLCQAVAVIEADARSGALITAKHALYQGREVFAVPGNVGETGSEGCNKLLAGGAALLSSANDILSRFEFLYPHTVRLSRRAPAGSRGADMTAGAARIVSASDPKSKYYGEGVYGGKKRRSGKKSGKPEETGEALAEAKDTPVKIVQSPEKAAELAREKTARMRHVHVDMLGDKERDIYFSMKLDTPMLPDEIAGGKYSISEVLAAMTLLEIAGAVEAGAGGYYIRCANEFDDLLEESAGREVQKV